MRTWHPARPCYPSSSSPLSHYSHLSPVTIYIRTNSCCCPSRRRHFGSPFKQLESRTREGTRVMTHDSWLIGGSSIQDPSLHIPKGFELRILIRSEGFKVNESPIWWSGHLYHELNERAEERGLWLERVGPSHYRFRFGRNWNILPPNSRNFGKTECSCLVETS